MDSNTHSTWRPPGRRDGLASLAAVVEELAAQDLHRLTDAALAERVLGLRRLLDRLEGHWLRELAAVDGRGAAGADQDEQAASTAGWLRSRLRLGAGAASSCVRTARALFRGPLAATAAALTGGAISVAHARVLAHGTRELPDHLTVEAEPVLVEAASRLDPPRLRRVLGHLQLVADPDGSDDRAERRHARRGLWLAPTFEGMVAVDGLLEAEAGQSLLAALEPLARPAGAHDRRSGGQRRADALAELARRALEAGRLPQVGGVRPQLLVTVDLDSLLGRPGGLGGEAGWAGPLDPEACRRLACDGAVTRVIVTRQPNHHPDLLDPTDKEGSAAPDRRREQTPPARHPSDHPHPSHHSTRDLGPGEQLRAAMALLPPILGGAPTQPLEVGRTSRVVQAAQRSALAVRDGGCGFPGCQRPLAWCEAHHLRHWLHGGPTDLANLALLCRTHHRAVHEGGWRLHRGPDGRLTAIPPPGDNPRRLTRRPRRDPPGERGGPLTARGDQPAHPPPATPAQPAPPRHPAFSTALGLGGSRGPSAAWTARPTVPGTCMGPGQPRGAVSGDPQWGARQPRPRVRRGRAVRLGRT
jgi:hypothetical protein